jgi:hypothetical protein
MTNRRAAFVAILWLSSYAYAAEQMILGKKFQIAAKGYPDPGVILIGKITLTAQERTSSKTIVGDPVANGGSLRVIVNLGPPCPACPVTGGDATLDQTFALPAAGWSALGTTGFKYSNAQAGAAVAKVIIKKNASGGFVLRALLRRADVTGLLQIDPYSRAPGLPRSGGIVLTLVGGDDYCVGFGASAGGRTSFIEGGRRPPPGHRIGQTVVRMTNATAEACPASSSR